MRVHPVDPGMGESSRKDDEIARTLLIELLAHQFCFPVRWIETQDLILGSRKTERVVEIGPGNTLINMARRTISRQYATRDIAQNISRQLLSFNQNLDDICFNQKLTNPPMAENPANKSSNSNQESKTLPLNTSVPSASTSAPFVTVLPRPSNIAIPSEVQDVPITALDVTKTIISLGLKKPLDGIDISKSIKFLSGGRSTVQNEIIGDLSAEFATMPEGVEDMGIESFCSTMQETFSGKLGAKCLSIIDKMASQKCPTSFQNAAIRKHLKQKWGFGPGRQNAILLWAVTTQPQSRLQNDDDVKALIDEIVQLYVNKIGLVLPDQPNPDSHSKADTFISSEAVELLESRQKNILEEQLGVYAKLLGVDLHAAGTAYAALEQRIRELEGLVDEWNLEHGQVYSSSLQPMFTPLKTRVYDSWWNWAMQDLLILVSMAPSVKPGATDSTLVRLRRSLIQRSHPRLVNAIQYLQGTTSDPDVADMLRQVLAECNAVMGAMPAAYRENHSMAPMTVIDKSGKILYSETQRPVSTGMPSNDDHLLRLGRKSAGGWHYMDTLSSVLHRVLIHGRTEGISLPERNVLITGAGEGSIGCQLVSKLLSAGAHVIVTSSSYSLRVTRFYQRLFSKYGSKGSRLILVPFNQASVRDIEALLTYVYADDGLGMDLDYVIPFAAISENGRALDNIDSRSEVAHRVMLTNTMRLIGKVKQQKEAQGITTRPAQVILPLSPNHGTLGCDGLYAESKLGLESLFDKFHSEDWAEYILVCGALIGWTRGTKLMLDNDIVSEHVEKHGVRTYSQDEMAFHILALMDPAIVSLCTEKPLMADLSGGMALVDDLQTIIRDARDSITRRSAERRAIAQEVRFDSSPTNLEAEIEPQANIDFKLPSLPGWDTDIVPLAGHLGGMVDLDRVAVVTGFGEIGPWGNSRIRWDMESNQSLSQESCIELAWIMGLLKAHAGTVNGNPYSGWIDSETGQPIPDRGIRDKYEKFMLEHAGIRYAESKKHAQSWASLETLHQVEISKDHDPIVISKETARQLKKIHGDKLHIIPNEATDEVNIVLKKGARIMIPKLHETQHTVAGQVPAGWDARVYGIPEDIINQVDPVTLYALVASAEAFQSAGILDQYEVYDHVHVSEVANCVGSGFGGITSMRRIFKERYQDQEASKDILAEAFISSGSAWINMLLLSGAGPNKTPVGACATALESLDTAVDLIQSQKAKICLVGGFDDSLKEVSTEFANLKATVPVDEDAARGREPAEMSRPSTSTRSGFVESEGAGIQVVTSASLALKMGLPIYTIIALTRTAMDKAGRSIPAPGRGLVGAALQRKSKYDSPLMNMAYRKRSLQVRLQQSAEMRMLQLSYLDEELAHLQRQGYNFNEDEYRQQRLASIECDAHRDLKDAINMYGNQFWIHDDRIAPMRGALAVWGLTIDDIDVVSFHGTSTKANELNEAAVINEQLKHLGRKKGNVVPVVCQKALTGHPKGAARAWMLNGCMQLMHAGRIPGNRNADNIDAGLEEFEYLVFPSKPIDKPHIKAFITQSFGFGQKGAMAMGVNPKYLYATMKKDDFISYQKRRRWRERKASRNFDECLFNNCVFKAKDKAPYVESREMEVLVDPDARLS